MGRASSTFVCRSPAHAVRQIKSAASWGEALHILGQVDEQHINVIVVGAAIGKCAKSAKWQYALVLLAQLEKTQLQSDAVACSSCISACAKAEQWQVALQLLSHAESSQVEADSVLYGSAMASCAAARIWHQALALFSKLQARSLEPGSMTTSSAFNAVIGACVSASSWSQATALISDLQNGRLTADVSTYNNAISALGNAHLWQTAVQMFSDLQVISVSPDRYSHAAVIAACDRASHWQRACGLLASWDQRSGEKDTVIFNAAIGACATCEQWQQSLQLLSDMRFSRLPLSMATFFGVVTACAAGGHWQHSLQLLCEVETTKAAGNLMLWNQVLLACQRGAAWSCALALMRTLDEAYGAGSTDARAYAGVLSSCVRSGLWQRGASLLADCRGFRVTLDLTAHSESITACHRAQQWQLAVDMMHAVHQNSLQFDVMLCNTAISICETGRRWRDAVYVFESMEKMSFDLDVVTITSAMSACERSGQWQLALALFQEIQKRRLEPNGLTCRTLISACSENTQWALRLLQDMAKQAMEGVVITFNDAISQFGQTARWRQALMCSDTLTFHGLQLDGVTYISRTSALARADRWQDCLEQVKTLTDCKLEVDFETKASNAALSACSGHLWPYAVALFAELDRRRLCSASSYASLMTLCEHSGQWKISLSLLSVLADAESSSLQFDLVALNAALGNCAAALAWQVALDLVYRRCSQIPGDVNTFNQVIRSFDGHWEMVLATLAAMEDRALNKDHRSYGLAMSSLISASTWPWALELFGELRTRQMRPDKGIYDALIPLALRVGLTESDYSHHKLQRCSFQKSPDDSENLIGKPLFPHISYRHMSVMVNMGKKPFTKMPFVCRMVADAAASDSKVETPPKDGKCEVVMPVAFPDEGTFDWLDSFLEEKPSYTELSDRRIQEWAVTSGLPRPKVGPQASNDKPYYMYGLPSLDDMSTQKVVSMLAPMQPRNYVVMEVKSNLIKEEMGAMHKFSPCPQQERAQVLKRFPSTHFKKVAYVVMGEPGQDYKARVRNKILKIKQDKADSTWRIKKAQQEQKKRMIQRQKDLEAKKKEAEDAKKKLEEEANKTEQEEGAEKKAEDTEAAAEEPKPDEEMKKEDEPAPEEEEDLGDEPPKVELTEEEENLSFLPKGAVPDLTPSVLSKAFANFTIPEKDEGFDEIKFIWQ
ncbi:EMB2654, partial [Symbiodinium necroappetens]